MDILNNSDNSDTITMSQLVTSHKQTMKQIYKISQAVDLSKCTYQSNYISQPVYSCLTCHPSDSPYYSEGGFCLSCSISCHENHDIIELYTKRKFKCDCGNVKFGGLKCTLEPNKDDYNDENKYNHNFGGKYCICNGDYLPDDTMIQCLRCQVLIFKKFL